MKQKGGLVLAVERLLVFTNRNAFIANIRGINSWDIFLEAQPTLAADRQGAECESRNSDFTFRLK
jgi:hypothetical protein